MVAWVIELITMDNSWVNSCLNMFGLENWHRKVQWILMKFVIKVALLVHIEVWDPPEKYTIDDGFLLPTIHWGTIFDDGKKALGSTPTSGGAVSTEGREIVHTWWSHGWTAPIRSWGLDRSGAHSKCVRCPVYGPQAIGRCARPPIRTRPFGRHLRCEEDLPGRHRDLVPPMEAINGGRLHPCWARADPMWHQRSVRWHGGHCARTGGHRVP